ncbi:MAG: sugar nucleotide-binding protein [Planctomycetaceae bacterium]
MDSILVVGTDTVVGSNLAAHWAENGWNVSGLSRAAIDVDFAPTALDEARRHMASARPSILVYCGAASESAWSYPTIDAAAEAHLRIWARAARDAGCRFTYLSSDAVFTGPWLFHAEDSPHQCPSLEGSRLRTMEELVERVVPTALIVRTNAFGWSPDGEGWVETLLADLDDGALTADPVRHATPILATDLASILARAHEEELTGPLHIAGAERVSHASFARRLAAQFELDAPAAEPAGALAAAATGFGRGETSLRTKRAKNVLNTAMPMLAEGLARLHAQSINGFQNRVAEPTGELHRVA